MAIFVYLCTGCTHVYADSFIWKPGQYEIQDYLSVKEYRVDPLYKERVKQLVGDLVHIPGGQYRMGDLFGFGNKEEQPIRYIQVKSFLLNKFEVTQSLWVAVMGRNPSHFNSCNSCPVENVSWTDIQEFIKRLNKLTKTQYRLPTEAEWEYACRSGGKRQRYCGDRDPDSLFWYENNSNSKTHVVGEKLPNNLGLYDMSGNVWEWVQDCWYGSYSGAPQNGSARKDGDCGRRVLRGGSWINKVWNGRSAQRSYGSRDDKSNHFGFRLATDI
ncbi:MAG: formylglycine-generating enzyme family protein [Candidatus Thiodiazotropha taylori]|nr:formylglycine-generating enzyme family protein [Candidatus Thiodiazotropha taylori]